MTIKSLLLYIIRWRHLKQLLYKLSKEVLVKNSKLFFLLTLVAAINVHANPVKFICSDSNQHSLEINVDDRYINNSMSAPDLADVSFVFDSDHFKWKKVEYITLRMDDGQMATMVREDVINKLYIQQAANGPSALATLVINQKQTDFDCTKYANIKGL